MSRGIPKLPKGGVAREIVLLLRNDPRRLRSPKQIAALIGRSGGTVRKELRRLVKPHPDGSPPPITAYGDGLYRAFIDLSQMSRVERPDLGLHSIQMTCRLPHNKGWGISGGGPPIYGGLRSQSPWRKIERDSDRKWLGQFMRDFTWSGRRFFVTVSSRTGTVQVSMSASESPLTPKQFEDFLNHLDPLMEGLGLMWRRSDVEVPLNNLEINWDYKELCIGGRDRVKLKKFRNAWAQVYQKTAEILRMEVRMHSPVDEYLKWSELASIFQTITTPLREEAEKDASESEEPRVVPEPWDGEVV